MLIIVAILALNFFCLKVFSFALLIVIATAVTSHPVDQPDIGGSRQRVAEQSLKNIQEGRIPPATTMTTTTTRSSSSGKGWFKRIAEG